MPRNIQLNGDLSLTNNLDVGGDVDINGSLENGFETALTNDSTPALLTTTVAAQSLPNGVNVGTQKSIILDQFTYTPDNQWQSAGTGLPIAQYGTPVISGVHHLTYDTGHIYATTTSQQLIGGLNVYRIFKFNKDSGIPSALQDSLYPAREGVTNDVHASDKYESNVFFGGAFSQFTDGTQVLNIAQYDAFTQRFTELHDPDSGYAGVNQTVRAVRYYDSNVWIGGAFTTLRDSGGGSTTSAHRIARWNIPTSSWHKVIDSSGVEGVDGTVYAIAYSGTKIFLGGDFTNFQGGGGGTATRIAVYDYGTNLYSELNEGSGARIGVNGTVWSLEAVGDKLIVGGQFTEITGSSPTIGLPGFAIWNISTSEWTVPTSPLSALPYRSIRALKNFGDSNVYVGGGFGEVLTTPSATNADFIVKYDTVADTWEAFDDGVNTGVTWSGVTLVVQPAYIKTIEKVENDVYVGGYFNTLTDGTSVGGLAKWDQRPIPLTISGSLWENGGSVTTTQLTLLGDKMDVVWNGSYWLVKK